jgi:hypothetical protein
MDDDFWDMKLPCAAKSCSRVLSVTADRRQPFLNQNKLYSHVSSKEKSYNGIPAKPEQGIDKSILSYLLTITPTCIAYSMIRLLRKL